MKYLSSLMYILLLLFLLLLLPASRVLAQLRVTGSVINSESKEPLAGVSVTVKGTESAVLSDSLGRFAITVPSSQTILVFSYVGFAGQEMQAGTGNDLTVNMAPLNKSLEEVVVIGYGTVKRRDLTGAVSSVKAEDIVKLPTQNVIEAIQGRVPGADITRTSGNPGAGVNIVVRGNKSITTDRTQLGAKNGPLYIIDGFQGGDINTLNAQDIESIEVLKDASSTAIYGAQGANGVIIVTTKKGVAGQARIAYSGFAGLNEFQYPRSRIGDDYIRLRREAARTTGEWSSPADDPQIFSEFEGEYDAVQAGQWVDWVDLVSRDGMEQSHTLSVTGGSAKTKVFASAGYYKETGMFRNSDYKRFSARLNMDQTINSWAKAGILSQLTYSVQNLRNDPLSVASSISPLGIPYNADGHVSLYPIPGDSSRVSPLADEVSGSVARDNNLVTNVTMNGYLEITPLEGLTIRSNLGTNLSFNRRGIFNDKQSLARSNVNVSLASSDLNFNRFLNWDNIITYNKEINDHSFTLTGISSYLQSDADETFAQGVGQLLSSQLFYDLASTSTNAGDRTITTDYTGWNNLAFAARINYSYKGKYLLTLSGRYDGASRLSEGNRWDFFPSAGIGWNIREENFMEDVRAVNSLKLRATYGVSGNYNVDVYGTQSLLIPYPNMSFGDEAAPGYYFSGRVANPDLGWERSATTDIGLDVSLLDNRLDMTVDVYNTVTSDILLPRPLPLSSGVTDVFENIGQTKNRGIEIAINSRNIQQENFTWSTGLTFSSNKEEITRLLNDKDLLSPSGVEDNSLLLGHPIYSFYNYIKEGIWQTSEAAEAATYVFGGVPFQPGDIKLRDLQPADPSTGIHTIDGANDRTYIGSAVPKWVAGLQNTFTYKSFDLGIYLFARYGQMIKAEFLGRYNPAGTGNGLAIIDYWTPEDPTNDFPRPKRGSVLSNYTGYQTLTYVDGSFFKIKTVTLGYTLPGRTAKKLSLSRFRIYATAANPLIVARSHLIKDYDPERGGSESSPLGKQYVLGINLEL